LNIHWTHGRICHECGREKLIKGQERGGKSIGKKQKRSTRDHTKKDHQLK